MSFTSQVFTILPSGEMRKVSRIAMVIGPACVVKFLTGTPYSSTTLCSGSASILKEKPSLVHQVLWLSTVSSETPRTTAFEASYLGRSRWKLWASMEQPEVWSLG